MNFDKAIEHYVRLRKECEAIEARAKAEQAEMKKQMGMLESWMTQEAAKDGLKSVPTEHGTACWSMHSKCGVSAPSEFFDFVKENELWELVEKRAAKKAVEAYIEEYKEVPPGVTFSKVQVFNVRAAGDK